MYPMVAIKALKVPNPAFTPAKGSSAVSQGGYEGIKSPESSSHAHLRLSPFIPWWLLRHEKPQTLLSHPPKVQVLYPKVVMKA